MGLPPSQVPFTSGAGTLRQSDIKKKSILSIRVKTRLVAYTRVITDSTRIFDRGRSLVWRRCHCWSSSTVPAPPQGR